MSKFSKKVLISLVILFLIAGAVVIKSILENTEESVFKRSYKEQGQLLERLQQVTLPERSLIAFVEMEGQSYNKLAKVYDKDMNLLTKVPFYSPELRGQAVEIEAIILATDFQAAKGEFQINTTYGPIASHYGKVKSANRKVFLVIFGTTKFHAVKL